MMSRGNTDHDVTARHAHANCGSGPLTAAVFCGALLSGCAMGASPPQSLQAQSPPSLQAMRMDMVRRLAAQCYWHHEGERLVLGPQSVYMACRDWADRRVRAHLPPRMF